MEPKDERKGAKLSSSCIAFMALVSFLCFVAHTGIFCCGSMGWIASIQTGFNRPPYLLQSKETDVQFSEAWLISGTSDSMFICNCAITSNPG